MANGPEVGMTLPILISVSVTPVSFLQGFGALIGFRLSNWVLGSLAAAATPDVTNPTLTVARTQSPAIARPHRRSFMDFPPGIHPRQPITRRCAVIFTPSSMLA